MTVAYDIATTAIVGLMAGNELAVAVFVHPQLYKVDDRTHTKIAAPLASILGKAMPLWYGLALVLILGAASEHRPISSGPGLFLLLAGGLWAVTILFTIAMLVPINNRIAKIDPEHPYDCWLQDRRRWDRLHQARVVLLIMAFLLLLTGLFGIPANATI
ncbi:anthrone oxygenase family protein [Granulicella sp. S190]|uniref:anthrone oxygenase family protein n=1 Tax=Granulicella sp. S190 TaxID=1747226 RepID=UPI00131B1D7D|nr:anthrone oxygenase family protein [Granulicella sp. S190]